MDGCFFGDLFSPESPLIYFSWEKKTLAGKPGIQIFPTNPLKDGAFS
jgi:hypothetical protein